MTTNTETGDTAFFRRTAAVWLAAAVLLLTVLAFWLPFGFNVGFVGDGWYFYSDVRTRIHTGPYVLPWETSSRPMLMLTYIVGYALSPGHFLGFNFVLALLLLTRSGLVYSIFRQFGAGRAFAFAIALLTCVQPADSGVFYMGALTVYMSWDAYLLAFCLLLLAWQSPLVLTIPLMGLACVALLACVGAYEAAYPLILISPLALLLVKRMTLRRWIAIAAVWYVVPALNVLRIFVLLHSNADVFKYQSDLVNPATSLITVFTNLVHIYQQHFVTSWFGSALTPRYGLIAIGIGILAFAACWWLARDESPGTPRRYGIYTILGLVVIALCVLIYLPTSLATDTVRLFFGSSVGAGLTLAALLRLIGRRALVFALLVGIVASLGSAQLLEQHARYFQGSEAQQDILVRLTAVLPELKPRVYLAVMDETPDRELSRVFGSSYHFGVPFPVLYPHNTPIAALCYPDDSPEKNSESYCAFHDNAVEMRITSVISPSATYNQLILLRYTVDREFVVAPDLAPYGNSSAYNPESLIDRDSPPTQVLQHMNFESN